jgi:HPt (histidine-containing phosphotransfer) domain-containing protein
MDAVAQYRELGRGPQGRSAQGGIDRAHLARYTLGDAALEAEVLTLFLDDLPRRIEALGSAATPTDWKMTAHTLKGSARAVGAWQLAEIAQAAEQAGFPDGAPMRGELVDRLVGAAALVTREIAEICRTARVF